MQIVLRIFIYFLSSSKMNKKMNSKIHLPVFPCIQFESSLQTLELPCRRNLVDRLGLPHSTLATYCEEPVYASLALRLILLIQHYVPDYTDETFADFSAW